MKKTQLYGFRTTNLEIFSLVTIKSLIQITYRKRG